MHVEVLHLFYDEWSFLCISEFSFQGFLLLVVMLFFCIFFGGGLQHNYIICLFPLLLSNPPIHPYMSNDNCRHAKMGRGKPTRSQWYESIIFRNCAASSTGILTYSFMNLLYFLAAFDIRVTLTSFSLLQLT